MPPPPSRVLRFPRSASGARRRRAPWSRRGRRSPGALEDRRPSSQLRFRANRWQSTRCGSVVCDSVRILMTIHHPLDADAGAPGTTLDLAAAYEGRGHRVTVISMTTCRRGSPPGVARHFSPAPPREDRPACLSGGGRRDRCLDRGCVALGEVRTAGTSTTTAAGDPLPRPRACRSRAATRGRRRGRARAELEVSALLGRPPALGGGRFSSRCRPLLPAEWRRPRVCRTEAWCGTTAGARRPQRHRRLLPRSARGDRGCPRRTPQDRSCRQLHPAQGRGGTRRPRSPASSLVDPVPPRPSSAPKVPSGSFSMPSRSPFHGRVTVIPRYRRDDLPRTPARSSDHGSDRPLGGARKGRARGDVLWARSNRHGHTRPGGAHRGWRQRNRGPSARPGSDRARAPTPGLRRSPARQDPPGGSTRPPRFGWSRLAAKRIELYERAIDERNALTATSSRIACRSGSAADRPRRGAEPPASGAPRARS